MTRHRADLDEMRSVVDALAGRLTLLQELAAGLARGQESLEPTWTGYASSAHTTARACWDAGFSQMRDALGDMRAVVAAAREHYEAAAEVNLVLWGELG